ncbi:hypothetical protein LX64_00183 [Chitinophaga skermanii]|uniref:Uncharacterized protein n=1 Tax=Chitinophaga skermanii TaxID=331697 RepID=A0A327R3E1_9BACT|nr:hypothetical protein LX64_00183 [Chitinophaga skermanii]
MSRFAIKNKHRQPFHAKPIGHLQGIRIDGAYKISVYKVLLNRVRQQAITELRLEPG